MSTAQNVFSVSQIPTPRQIARGEISSVRVKVRGYWSSDSITIYTFMNVFSGPKFKIEMTHSSGGRDTKEVESDIDAEENFGIALQGAAVIARQIEKYGDEIMTEYAIYKAELQTQAKAEQEAKDAIIAADPAMSKENAEIMMHFVKSGRTFKLYERGQTEVAHTLYRSGRFFYLSFNSTRRADMAIGKDKLLAKLTDMSARFDEAV